MFKFQEGDTVAVKSGSPTLGLAAGDTGTVWAIYDTQPPAYEVICQSSDGDEFSMVLSEDELVASTAVPEITSRKSHAKAAA